MGRNAVASCSTCGPAPAYGAWCGLTLIEVLVSLSIGAIVVGAVLGVLSTAQRTRQQGEARCELFQSVRVALSEMERDLRVAVYRESDPEFEFIGTDLTEGGLPADSFEFAAASGSPLTSVLPTGDLLRLQYYVDLSEDSSHRGLVRQAMSIPLPEQIPPEQEELAARVYCPVAVGLDVMYYDSAEQTWVEEWQERTELPSSVRIVLYVLPAAAEEGAEPVLESLMPFSTVVHLTLAAAPLGQGQPNATTEQAGAGAAEPTGPGEPGPEGAPEEEFPSPLAGPGQMPGVPSLFGGGGGR